MPRQVLTLVLAALLMSRIAIADENPEPRGSSCSGLPVSHFESRFPAKFKRLVFKDDMLETFVELWKAGSRPELPRLPERVIVYAFAGLPLIIGYQEQHCIIAYLAIESDALRQWLHLRLGWNA